MQRRELLEELQKMKDKRMPNPQNLVGRYSGKEDAANLRSTYEVQGPQRVYKETYMEEPRAQFQISKKSVDSITNLQNAFESSQITIINMLSVRVNKLVEYGPPILASHLVILGRS